MVDITAKLFWYRAKEWYEIMADKLTDIVYTDESKETIDVINLLLLGWILLGLIVYIIGNIVASYLRKRQSSSPIQEPADENLRTKENVSGESELKASVDDVFLQEKPKISHEIPVSDGDDQEIVDWINNVFSWIYKQRVVSPVIDAWLSALNARTRLSSTEHGILVDFKDLHASSPPQITDVRQSYTYRSDINLSGQMEVKDMTFEIVVTQFKEKEKVTIPFVLNLQRIFGRIVIECVPEDLTFLVKYSETPQIQLSSETSKDHETSEEDHQPLCDLVSEITSEALSSAIVNLRFNCFPACPRLLLKTHSEDDVFEAAENDTDKQLLVKIIKASKLGGSKGCSKPYCVVEMDEPPQKFETQIIEATDSPFWDESFKFIVKDSAELLFEIYDKDKPSKENFLGLGIVGMDELIKNPSQRQIIPLQSRPLEEDDVTGSLTAEFVFLNQSTPVVETTHLAQHIAKENGYANSGKTVETNSRVTAGGTVITTTTIKRTKEEAINRMEPKHDPKANSNSLHSAVPNLHKVEEALEQKKTDNVLQKSNALSEQLAKNGDCKILNGTLPLGDCTNTLIQPQSDINKCFDSKCLPHNPLDSIQNKQENNEANSELLPINSIDIKPEADILPQKQFNLNKIEQEFDSSEADIVAQTQSDLKLVKVENSETELEIKHSNAGDLSAINLNKESDPVALHVFENKPIVENSLPPMHVHVSPPIPTFVVEAPQENETFLEILENKSHDYKDADSNIASLPLVAESDEISSLPSNGLEKSKDAEADVPGTALKELEKHSTPTATSKSTLIIHSVQRPDNSMSESLEASPASHVSKDSRTSYSESVPSSPSPGMADGDRSRPKEKKTLMGTLRRRLSFHKNRSKSAENRFESASNFSQASSRSTSADRVRQVSAQKLSPFKGKFLGQFLNVPGSTRSSLSEASGISASSSRTYINENSTLIIETNENGIIKRYLIPNSLIHRSKWKKRGTKLHIYNDHVFLAKHLSGTTVCQVCQKNLTRRPGKQGYECRGCNLQCHKSCHVKVEGYCSNSSVNSMEVEYIHDPKGASPKSI